MASQMRPMLHRHHTVSEQASEDSEEDFTTFAKEFLDQDARPPAHSTRSTQRNITPKVEPTIAKPPSDNQSLQPPEKRQCSGSAAIRQDPSATPARSSTALPIPTPPNSKSPCADKDNFLTHFLNRPRATPPPASLTAAEIPDKVTKQTLKRTLDRYLELPQLDTQVKEAWDVYLKKEAAYNEAVQQYGKLSKPPVFDSGAQMQCRDTVRATSRRRGIHTTTFCESLSELTARLRSCYDDLDKASKVYANLKDAGVTNAGKSAAFWEMFAQWEKAYDPPRPDWRMKPS